MRHETDWTPAAPGTPVAAGVRSRVDRPSVTASASKAFALATEDDNPGYERDGYAPPAYGTVIAGYAMYNLFRSLLPGYPDTHVIHLASDISFVRPLVPEAEMVADAVVTHVRPTARGALMYVLSRLATSSGDAVLEQLTTVLLPEYRDVVASGEPPADIRPVDVGRASRTIRRVVAIADELPLRYAAASGDWQKVHFDDDWARAMGLPRRVLHGACTLALCASAVVELVGGGDPTRLARLALRFARPVHPGTRLSIEISEGTPGDGLSLHAVRATCDGRPVIRNGRADVRA